MFTTMISTRVITAVTILKTITMAKRRRLRRRYDDVVNYNDNNDDDDVYNSHDAVLYDRLLCLWIPRTKRSW